MIKRILEKIIVGFIYGVVALIVLLIILEFFGLLVGSSQYHQGRYNYEMYEFYK